MIEKNSYAPSYYLYENSDKEIMFIMDGIKIDYNIDQTYRNTLVAHPFRY